MGNVDLEKEMIVKDAVATLSRYVQFDTTNPPGNEMPAARWLREQLNESRHNKGH